MSILKSRPLTPQGHRPYPTGEPHVERVLSITMAVAAEVAVLHERLDTVLRLAGTRDRFTVDDIETFEVSPELAAEREEWRKTYLTRILRILHEAVPAEAADDGAEYKKFINEISTPVEPKQEA
jgi:hypothetical protein